MGAVVSSSLFALALESHGSTSMGAGALEVTTKKLPDVPVIDVRLLSRKKQSELIKLANAAWKEESPVNWGRSERPGPLIERIDDFLVKELGKPISLDAIYSDITEMCRARSRLAKDKKKTVKGKLTSDVDAVVATIAESASRSLQAHRFPEEFVSHTQATISFDFTNYGELTLTCSPLLTHATVILSETDSDKVIFSTFALGVEARSDKCQGFLHGGLDNLLNYSPLH